MSRRQATLNSFFESQKSGQKRSLKTALTRKPKDSSSFATCPICQDSLPYHQLERHAAGCDDEKPLKKARVSKEQRAADNPVLDPSKATSEPIPGLYLFEDFITLEEEIQILAELDGRLDSTIFLPWKQNTFNGKHRGKRWGVHCNLRSRRVEPAENPLPSFMTSLLLPRLPLKDCFPNEANAIDYRRRNGDYLKAHVDDRQLSKEPIANLSLAGDCYMTFTNVQKHRNTAVASKKVLLKRRCLQILTGKARYDFSHAIENNDLLSDRRVSFTMRESPITTS